MKMLRERVRSFKAKGPVASGVVPARKDEGGAVLILALIFLVIVGAVVGSLATWATNDLNNTAKFTSARTQQYAVSSAMETAIENIRYTPLFSTQLLTTPATPSYCWGSSSPSQVTIDNLNVAVWCSMGTANYNAGSAQTRVVTLSACPVTASESASSCAANPSLQAVVTFGDYPPGYSAPNTGQCVVYCGTSMTVNSWVWGSGFGAVTTTTTTVPPTTTTTVPPTTTTTTVPPTTTTTSVPPTTTTTTAPRSNGVTAGTSTSQYGGYGGQDILTLANSSSITALSVTINVAQTPGVYYFTPSPGYNTYPPGAVTDSETTSGGVLSYTYVLNSGQTISAQYGSGVVAAQYGGSGFSRVTTGDTWSVTSTSGGITSTITGTF
jgi:hypothetical protein